MGQLQSLHLFFKHENTEGTELDYEPDQSDPEGSDFNFFESHYS